MNRIFLIIFLILTIFSCSSYTDIEENNEAFLDQYSKEVNKITSQREAALTSTGALAIKQKKTYGWQDPGDILGISGVGKFSSASIDTSKITLPKKSGEFLPDMAVFLKGRGTETLPDEIFKVSYNLENYPASYKEDGVNFDDIVIPDRDYYGVKTDFGVKSYNLPDGQNLQHNIDYLNNNITDQDRDINVILIKEQKELINKRRMQKLGIKN